MAFIAVYDANVLYPAALRDLLLEMASAGEFRARFSAEILDEVFEHLAANFPEVDPPVWLRTRELMERAVPDALVTGHIPLVASLTLPDPDDRHVLAAAIKAGAQVIVSDDADGFPPDVLAEWGIERQSADTFVQHLADLHPGIVIAALHRISARLSKPPRTPAELLDTLERAGLVQTAAQLRPLVP